MRERTRKFRRTCLDEAPQTGCHDIFGGGGGSTTTVQKSDPWKGAQPYLRDLFGRAQQQSFAPQLGAQSPYTQQAIQAQASSAQDPNGLVGMAQGELGRTIRGDYMSIDNNPAAQAAMNAARRGVNSQFSGDNYGSSAHQEWLGRGLTEAASPFLAQERQNQLSAINAAPGLQMANINQLAGAGAAQDARSQAEVDAPNTALARYQQLISGQGGGTTSASQPYFTNPAASALGGALGGYGLMSGLGSMAMLPMAAPMWGAIGGGLLGLMGGRR